MIATRKVNVVIVTEIVDTIGITTVVTIEGTNVVVTGEDPVDTTDHVLALHVTVTGIKRMESRERKICHRLKTRM